ncbi:EamA family transporter [Streptomyces sp. 8N706]|uniref:EamA family transporter n=1 Tax=Streptomyces sp. 8N706 TaxID=3457416 RepID=UPI003FCF1661
MGELLALASAVCFGSTHFVNGLVARRIHGMTVALYAQTGGTALSVVAAAFAGGTPTAQSMGWGALSGLGTGVGVAFLYRGMSRGAMSVVVPVSDVGAVALPVLVGLAVLGERPSALALAGIVVALPAIWLAAGGERPGGEGPDGDWPGGDRPGGERSGAERPGADRPRGARSDGERPGLWASGNADALLAGIGFAVQYLAIARVPAGTGLWPVVAGRVASVAVVAALLWRVRGPWRLPVRLGAPAAAAGACGTLALVLYLEATRQQLLAVATVLSALYPVIPVVLALALLHERVRRGQAAGLIGAGAAIGLIALR